MKRATTRLHIQLDVDYSDNPRIIQAGEAGELLYIRANCLAKKLLSDGYIDDVHISRFLLSDVEARVAQLCAVGLWKRSKTGYQIVGWLQRNDSAKQVRELSEKRRIAAKARRNGNGGGEQSA